MTGNARDGMGMFPFGSLLGSGSATSEGDRYIDDVVARIEKVSSDVEALLAFDSKPAGLGGILEGQWTTLELALDDIFGTDSNNTVAASRTSAARMTAPREEDILDDITDILDALASEDAFVAATAADGDGVFTS